MTTLLHLAASARRRSISRELSAAHLREDRERSYALALETAHRLGKEY